MAWEGQWLPLAEWTLDSLARYVVKNCGWGELQIDEVPLRGREIPATHYTTFDYQPIEVSKCLQYRMNCSVVSVGDKGDAYATVTYSWGGWRKSKGLYHCYLTLYSTTAFQVYHSVEAFEHFQ